MRLVICLNYSITLNCILIDIYRYHLNLCKNVFGEGIYPDVDMTNLYYGGSKIAGAPFLLNISFFFQFFLFYSDFIDLNCVFLEPNS